MGDDDDDFMFFMGEVFENIDDFFFGVFVEIGAIFNRDSFVLNAANVGISIHAGNSDVGIKS